MAATPSGNGASRFSQSLLGIQSRLGIPGGAAFIVAAALLAYLPSLRGQFIMDDNALVTDNALVKASSGLYRIWLTSEPVDYWPLTNTSFWIEWRLWGMKPAGYHVTNLILHIADAVLIWVILSQLSIPGAWLAALLFAVHPVNVESVAWISQRKNTLSMLFFLVSILWYLKSDRGVGGWYWLSLLAFILAMLSKGSVAILPLVLLLLAWWQRDEITRWDLVRTAPFFAVAVVLTAVNLWFQTHGSGDSARHANLLERLLGAGAVVWFYLYKALLPLNLVFVYPQWNIELADWRWWVPLLAAAVVSTVLLWQRNTRFGRPLLLAWGFFCVALLPVMGFTDVGFMKYSLVADHYQHIAILAVVALLAAGWSLWQSRAANPLPATIVATVLIGTLTFLSWQQSDMYRDPLTLYSTTLAKNPDSWLAENNLGLALATDGQTREALEHYNRAIDINPNSAMPHYNVGNMLKQTGRAPEAIEHYRQALRLKPDFPQAHYNLGQVLQQSGQLPEAIEHFEQALRWKPDYAVAHNNLGNALAQSGRVPEAIAHFEQAIQLRPDYVLAHVNLGAAYSQMNQPAQAIAWAKRGLDLARSSGQTELAGKVEAWLESYQGGRSNGPDAPSMPNSTSPQP